MESDNENTVGFKKISEYALAALFTLVALCITISTVVYLLDYVTLNSPASYLYAIGQFLFNSFHIVSFVLAIYFFTAAFLLIIERSSLVLFVELVFVSIPILLFTIGIKILFDGIGDSAPITRYTVELFGRNGGIIISFLLSAAFFLLTFYLRDIFNQTTSKDNAATNQQTRATSPNSLQYDLAAPLVQINTTQHPYSLGQPNTQQIITDGHYPTQPPIQQQPPVTRLQQPLPHPQHSPQQPLSAPQNQSVVSTTVATHNTNQTKKPSTSQSIAIAKPRATVAKPLSFEHENDIPAHYINSQVFNTSHTNASPPQNIAPTTSNTDKSKQIKPIATTAHPTTHNSVEIQDDTHNSNTDANSSNTDANSFVPKVDRSYLDESKDIEEAIADEIPSLVLKDGKISVAPVNNSEKYLSKIPHNISNVLPKSYQSTDTTPKNRFKNTPTPSITPSRTHHQSTKTLPLSNNQHVAATSARRTIPTSERSHATESHSGSSETTHNHIASIPPQSDSSSKKMTTYPIVKSTNVETGANTDHLSYSAHQPSSQYPNSTHRTTTNTADNKYPPSGTLTTKSEQGASHTTHIDNVDVLIDAIDNTVLTATTDNPTSIQPPTNESFSVKQHNTIKSADISSVSEYPTIASYDETVHEIEPLNEDSVGTGAATDYSYESHPQSILESVAVATDTINTVTETASTTVAAETLPPHSLDETAVSHTHTQTHNNPVVTTSNRDEQVAPVKLGGKIEPHTHSSTLTTTVPSITIPNQNWSLNAHQLLVHYPSSHEAEFDKQAQSIANDLKVTLAEFNIEAEIVGIRQGPVVTVYELLPAKGIKVAKISSLADNIALRLAAERVRIVAPIPGKQAIGIELPNKRRQTVGFDTIIQDPQFQDNSLTLPIGLGRGIGGDVACIDLSKTPHLLIAGSTGSGKSVCVNSIICSLMFSCSPVDVRMILIDPKIVELKVYNHIPHLLTPVITDTNRAAAALNYALTEMERRYELLDQQGVRDISGYNQIVDNEDDTHTTHMPYIVIIIDEFADLMHTGGKQIELTISRLAAMARAVGIHLVLATQRPSADVITGLIKANIPTRIAFMVSSKVDSRIILDISGAEQLLGRGDMLFVSSWDPNPIRIQGSLITDQEVKHIADAARQHGSPSYISEEDLLGATEQNGTVDDNDPLYQEAVAVVRSTGKASASYLQRRLQVGYNRAARLIETMEHHGIVGPANGSKAREVLG